MAGAISLPLFMELFERTNGRVQYLWGAKAPTLDADSASLRYLDCSGFAEWIVFRSSGGSIDMGEGSVAEAEWCRSQGYHQPAAYMNLLYAVDDPGRLFVAFLDLDDGAERHVWFVCAGRTYECYGGHGVGSRPWDTSVLVRATSVFELPIDHTVADGA